jgi:uncharacterized protein (DUF697 family)
MIAITLTDAGFVSKINRFAAQTKNPTGLMKVLGREAANRLKAHFRAKNKTPNKLGGKRENFWNRVGQSVQNPVVGSSGREVSVSINDPRFVRKVFGGTITAKRAKALSIPVTAEAYGRSPSTFEQETGLKLFLVRTGSGGFQNAVLATQRGKGLQVEYVLKKSVNQDADPTALPDEKAMEAALIARGESFLVNEARKEGLN